MTKQTPETIDWSTLGFNYIDTGMSFRAKFRNGKWEPGKLSKDNTVRMSEASPVLHYGQACFEGLKAYRTKEGDIQLFRPDQNAKRMKKSAEQLLMEAYPEDQFIAAIHQVVKANADWVPPYGTGASLYIRPFLYGEGDIIGVQPAKKYTFSVFVTPVGPYFKDGLLPQAFLVSEYDRAAPRGTGAVKVGGNYASSYLAGKEAKDQGFADAIFLDPATHTKIEEIGSSNFFGITKDKVFVTPASPSILPSITKYSLMWIAEKRLGLKTVEKEVYLDEIDQFVEAGAMGTAAVITPISSITYQGKTHLFSAEKETGPITQSLYEELVGIQFGDIEAPEGWIQIIQ